LIPDRFKDLNVKPYSADRRAATASPTGSEPPCRASCRRDRVADTDASGRSRGARRSSRACSNSAGRRSERAEQNDRKCTTPISALGGAQFGGLSRGPGLSAGREGRRGSGASPTATTMTARRPTATRSPARQPWPTSRRVGSGSRTSCRTVLEAEEKRVGSAPDAGDPRAADRVQPAHLCVQASSYSSTPHSDPAAREAAANRMPGEKH
jgi:hypothetical protein